MHMQLTMQPCMTFVEQLEKSGRMSHDYFQQFSKNLLNREKNCILFSSEIKIKVEFLNDFCTGKHRLTLYFSAQYLQLMPWIFSTPGVRSAFGYVRSLG